MRRTIQLIAVAGAAILALALTALPANASATTSAFAAQARAAGLTSGQTQALQSKVDEALTRTGGRQTGANAIELAPGVNLLVAVPGEERARDIALAPQDGICPFEDACLFYGPNYTANEIQVFYCNTWVSMPWASTNGSWVNTQTPGTKMKFHFLNGVTTRTMGAPEVASSGVNWGNIDMVSAC